MKGGIKLQPDYMSYLIFGVFILAIMYYSLIRASSLKQAREGRIELEPREQTITITSTPYKKELYELAPNLYFACRNIIDQKNKNELSEIDFSVLEQVIEQIQMA